MVSNKGWSGWPSLGEKSAIRGTTEERAERERERWKRKTAHDREVRKRLREAGIKQHLTKLCVDCGITAIDRDATRCRPCEAARRVPLPRKEERERQLSTPFRGGTVPDFERRVRLLEATARYNPL